MKLKKLNAALAVWAVSGGLFFWGSRSDETATANSSSADLITKKASLESSRISTSAAASALGTGMREDDFSPAGKQVATIPWSHSFDADKVPWEPVLKKWTVGDRVYYQMTGPMNSAFLGKPASASLEAWSSYLAYEVFFRRDGVNYDQWIVGPPQAVIYHHKGQLTMPPELGVTNLSNSRYRVVAADGHVTVTFWCHSQDTPANIAFNYQVPNGGGLAWFDTEKNGASPGAMQSHHDQKFWSNP